ncbi:MULTISPECIES: hypothetical protein [unclassified Streptomyces]|uniref:hypothetical protein n=1 Tax=unclassified Streptomyces TaxID=2593676 RepID=UPI0004C10D3A|nr:MULTISPECIES: hypothetical protein [unclassified Streptomyces]
MTRPPTAAQWRVIEAADPVTGRLRGTRAQYEALVKRGLAFRHPRPPHDHFLTPAGHRIREEGAGGATGAGDTVGPGSGSSTTGADGAPAATGPGSPHAATGSDVFAARVGGEDAPEATAHRTREVHSAWQGLLELRRMTNPDGDTGRPCGWERTHLVRAAALALEADGHTPAGPDPAGPGYRVRATPQPEAVAVHEGGPGALRACAATLERAGWQVSEHTEARTGRRYVLASPRRK